MTDQQALGKRIRRAREDAGLEQTDVAAALGVHSVTVSRWETGHQAIRAGRVVELAKLFKVPVDRLMADPLSENVSHGAPERVRGGPVGEVAQRLPRAPRAAGTVQEAPPPYLADEDGWEPTPTLRGLVPPRVYDVAISYCRRLAAAGLPRDEVEEAERLLIDPAYAKLNRRAKRELSEDEQIQIIDATWGIMQEVLSWKGVRA